MIVCDSSNAQSLSESEDPMALEFMPIEVAAAAVKFEEGVGHPIT